MTGAARRQRYLAAMGVVAWRLRDAGDTGEAEAPAGTPEAPQVEPATPLIAAADVGGPPSSPPDSRTGDTPPPSPEVRFSRRREGAAGDAAAGLAMLRERVAACTACALHESRTQTVFGVGNPDAGCMIVGEAPGADEDRRGEPFVGRAGQLLNAMLAAIGLARDDVFIANILKCRPPQNRDPRPQEVACCAGFLREQIGLTRPRILVAVGRIAAQNLLGTTQSLGRLRGQLHEHPDTGTPVLVTYHPAYLLRTPSDKAKAWQDLRRLRALLAEAT